MTMVLVMLRQIAIMALLILVGIFLSRRGFLSEQGTRDLGAVLLRVICPSVIVKSYITACTPERMVQFFLSVFLALITLSVAMLISWFVFGKRRRIENFAASFGNVGFIGIPLVQATVGEEGVFFIAASIALLSLFQWTYGVYVMTDDKNAISAKTIVKNPVVIAIVIGMFLFFTQIPVPSIVVDTLGYVAGMNTPVAMILMGTYMARLPLKRILLEKRAYACVLFRLLVIPLVTLFIFWLLPVQDNSAVFAVFVAAATPVGANICIFAQQNNCDYEYSVVTVCLSTLLSAATVPVLVSFAQTIL